MQFASQSWRGPGTGTTPHYPSTALPRVAPHTNPARLIAPKRCLSLSAYETARLAAALRRADLAHWLKAVCVSYRDPERIVVQLQRQPATPCAVIVSAPNNQGVLVNTRRCVGAKSPCPMDNATQTLAQAVVNAARHAQAAHRWQPDERRR